MKWVWLVVLGGLLGCGGGTTTTPTPPIVVTVTPPPAICTQYVLPALLQGWKAYGDCSSGVDVPGCITDIVNFTTTLALQYPACKDLIVITTGHLQQGKP